MALAGYDPSRGQTIKSNAGRHVPTVDMGFLAHKVLTNVAAADADYVHGAILLPASGTTVVTTAITNPDVPRNLTIVGNEADIVGTVTIVGTDMNNDALSEDIALNGVTPVLGTKAFKTVTSITVGIGDKIGLNHTLPFDTGLAVFTDAVLEDPKPPITASATVLAANLIDLDGLTTGTADFDIYYIV